MEFNMYKPEWLEALIAQEEILCMEKITADDAFTLGGILIRTAKEKYQKPAAFRIVSGGQVVFSFLMDGTSNNNNWWMDKKFNTCMMTGVSSIRSLVEVAEGLRTLEPEFENEGSFALCGGCFPVHNAAGKIIGWVLASGLPHECDHQLIIDAMNEFLGKNAPAIV